MKFIITLRAGFARNPIDKSWTCFPKSQGELTKRLSYQTEASARAEGVPIQHPDSPSIDKQETALELAKQHGRTTGRLALVSAVENCVTYRMLPHGRGSIQLLAKVIPQSRKGKSRLRIHFQQET